MLGLLGAGAEALSAPHSTIARLQRARRRPDPDIRQASGVAAQAREWRVHQGQEARRI
jgi:hypothetical protein